MFLARAHIMVIPSYPKGISDILQDLMKKDVQKQKFEPDVQR